jgi:hypothetical protein
MKFLLLNLLEMLAHYPERIKGFLEMLDSKVFVSNQPMINEQFLRLYRFSHSQGKSLPSGKSHCHVEAFWGKRKIIVSSSVLKNFGEQLESSISFPRAVRVL